MPAQSKIATAPQGIAPIILDMLVGSNKKKLVSTTVLLIIAFLIHVKNKKSYLEPGRPEQAGKG